MIRICRYEGRKGVNSYYEIIMSKSIKYFEGLTWDNIAWGNSYSKVRRIQKRIYKASSQGDTKRMWFLQKLLLRSPHAKLIAVQTVTTLNKGKNTAGIDKYKATSGIEKLKLAKTLQINGKANLIKKVWIPKPGKIEKRPLGIPTIHDRAKQALCKLVLEPEWEAKFEPNSYGFRPGRKAHDAMVAIFLNLHHDTDKFVFDADIKKCFEKINHEALLVKLGTFPLMEKQISAWLKAGIFDQYANKVKTSIPSEGTPQGGIISPLLSNIALHGLENHLMDFVSTRNFPKPHPGAAPGTKVKRAALGLIRYADDFLILHRNLEILNRVVVETKKWLLTVGLEISEEKSTIKKASQSFKFLGFQVAYLRIQGKYRIKITPAKENVKRIISKVRSVIQANKAVSSYQLIGKLRPIILGWGNYFQFCECKSTFSKVDNLIYQQIRAWVFRRAVRKGRIYMRLKYFPIGNEYKFQSRIYKANWILVGKKATKNSNKKPIENFLPKISWIQSKKYVKVKGSVSVYDGNEIYWGLRTPRYSIFSTRIKNLLQKQKGKCTICKQGFKEGDILEVDHIIPKFKGGKDQYKNLQLLHRQCHVKKTKIDLGNQ